MFDLVLSREGIEVRRPQRPVRLMSWDRVSEWEIEERNGYVLLTLRGEGATTPLVVPGWTFDDLELCMRAVTSDGTADEPDSSEAVVTDGEDAGKSAAVATVTASVPATSEQGQARSARTPGARVPASDAARVARTRAERRQRATRGAWRRRLTWKAVVTVVLLGVLATAVVLVLLQSAGIIEWNFLGPVA